MKIILVGNVQSPTSSESQYVALLRKMGHEVYVLQENGIRRDRVLRLALKSDLLVWIHTHQWLVRGIMSYEEMFRRLKEKGIPSLTYHLDLWLGLGRETDLETDPFYKHIEYFFTVDKLMADYFNQKTNVKGVYLPAGVFDDETTILPPKKARYDIVFSGSKGYHKEYPFRTQLINFLEDRYGERFLHIGKDTMMGNVRGIALNQIYSNAKIVIGDTLNIGFNYPYYSSDRLFEVTGRGGFIIYPDIKGLDKFFVPNKEVVFYKAGDLSDLKAKIDYYLKHDEEREAIRIAGHKRAIKDHLYSKRWQFILDEVTK